MENELQNADLKEHEVSALLTKIVAVEKVTHAALLRASDKFHQEAEDPGWTADMHENMLDEAIKEAAAAINLHREARRRLEGK